MNTLLPHEGRLTATEIDLLAADWLQRRNFWTWTAEDQVQLDAWLAQSRTYRIAYWRQKSVWEMDNGFPLCAHLRKCAARGTQPIQIDLWS